MTAGPSAPPDSPRTDTIAAPHDAPTKTGNCRQCPWHMSLIGGGVGYVDIADDVGGHGAVLAIRVVPSVSRKLSCRRNPLELEEGVRKSGSLGLISAGNRVLDAPMASTRRLAAT